MLSGGGLLIRVKYQGYLRDPFLHFRSCFRVGESGSRGIRQAERAWSLGLSGSWFKVAGLGL